MSNPRLIGALAGAVALLLAGASEADAARRVALVIGNDLYDHAPALGNARADAEALADRLEGLGFELFLGGDLDRGGMETLLRRFARAAQGAELALAFYAGHGLQVEEENWLLPVDARLESLLDLEYEAVPLALLLRALQGAGTRLLLLDACRDNPLAEEMALPAGSGGLRRGLARVERAEHGTLIAFATSPGAVAADGPAEGAGEGTGGHSPFAAALLRHLDEPGLELRELLTRVRREVRRATGGRQTPWEHSSLVGEVYLAGTVAGGTTRSAVPCRRRRRRAPPRALSNSRPGMPSRTAASRRTSRSSCGSSPTARSPPSPGSAASGCGTRPERRRAGGTRLRRHWSRAPGSTASPRPTARTCGRDPGPTGRSSPRSRAGPRSRSPASSRMPTGIAWSGRRGRPTSSGR